MKFIAALVFLISFEASANSCAQDAKKFCQGVDPGKGQLARCLSDYEANLSPTCAKELKEYKANTGKKNPCFEDLAEFCADIPSDPLNYEYCLIRNESRLSPKCSADFKSKKGRIITRNVCAQDIANVCYEAVSGPDGAINRCLIKNKSKVSAFCAKAVDQKVADIRKKNLCYDDTVKNCPTQIKFIDIQDCLAKKVPSLTPGCQKLVNNETAKMKANPCYRDLMTHCRPGLNPKDQSDCLTLNENHLSNTCKQYRVLEKSRVGKMVEMCEADRLKLCKNEPFKDGAVIKCLRKNRAQVTKGCQSYL